MNDWKKIPDEWDYDHWDDLSWEYVSGRDDPRQRYRLYRRRDFEPEPTLLTTCTDEESVGVAIIEITREGQLDDALLGILDIQGEKGRRWLLLPWLPGDGSDA